MGLEGRLPASVPACLSLAGGLGLPGAGCVRSPRAPRGEAPLRLWAARFRTGFPAGWLWGGGGPTTNTQRQLPRWPCSPVCCCALSPARGRWDPSVCRLGRQLGGLNPWWPQSQSLGPQGLRAARVHLTSARLRGEPAQGGWTELRPLGRRISLPQGGPGEGNWKHSWEQPHPAGLGLQRAGPGERTRRPGDLRAGGLGGPSLLLPSAGVDVDGAAGWGLGGGQRWLCLRHQSGWGSPACPPPLLGRRTRRLLGTTPAGPDGRRRGRPGI